MAKYSSGEVFKDVPVIKFTGYDGVIVFLNGRLEHARIPTRSNLEQEEPANDATAPRGTKAEVVVKKRDGPKEILYLEVRKIGIVD